VEQEAGRLWRIIEDSNSGRQSASAGNISSIKKKEQKKKGEEQIDE